MNHQNRNIRKVGIAYMCCHRLVSGLWPGAISILCIMVTFKSIESTIEQILMSFSRIGSIVLSNMNGHHDRRDLLHRLLKKRCAMAVMLMSHVLSTSNSNLDFP